MAPSGLTAPRSPRCRQPRAGPPAAQRRSAALAIVPPSAKTTTFGRSVIGVQASSSTGSPPARGRRTRPKMPLPAARDGGCVAEAGSAPMISSKAAVLTALGREWEIHDLTVSDPRPGEVLVQMAYAGLCYSDEHLRFGKVAQLPVVGGHEIGR